MSRLLALTGGAVLFAVGVAAGLALSQADPAAPDAAADRVVVRTPDGDERTLTLAEAAARIERLELVAARTPRARAAVAEAEDDAETPQRPPERELPDVPVPRHPDGRPYTPSEVRELARTATDPVLRAAAIRALRRDDTPEARALLQEIVTDTATAADLRAEAAKALARPPHRDQSPEELVKLLAAADLPAAVRVEIAEGVTRLRDRGAWMPEIAAQMAKEGDASVRALLFDAVHRAAQDPAAKAELVALVGNPAARPDEARLAAQALARLGNDKRALDALGPLLDHADPLLRAEAVAAWAKAGRLPLERVVATMGDATPAVRAAAFLAPLPQLAKNATKEEKAARRAALESAAQVALGDAEPDVRRAALAWASSMPPDLRDRVLATARSDGNALVSLEAYARSPAAVARAEPERILTQLDSPDPKARDAAYRLAVRTWAVDVPFRAGWNPAARARAVAEIRAQAASR